MIGKPPPLRAIVVHSLDHALAALRAAAALEVPVILATAGGAAGFAGALWFRELMSQAASAVPEARFEALLDCGEQAGRVLEALRQDCRFLRFRGPDKIAAKLRDIAEQSGAKVITGPLETLDLLYEHDPEAACRRWLQAAEADQG